MENGRGRPYRLPCWDYGDAGCYFVTFCTKDRRCILSQIVGRDDPGAPLVQLTSTGDDLLQHVEEIPTYYPNVTLHNYVIMPNHVHLLLSIDATEEGAPGSSRPTQQLFRIVSVLKRLSNQYAKTNLWQKSFHDHIIRNEHDYLRIWQYIDTNPLKWELDRYYTQSI